jgi:hypothetical protein
MSATAAATATTTTANGKPTPLAEIPLEDIERTLVQGDLSRLTSDERLVYYRQVCQSLGLNPLTRPFEYLNLKGKLILYARKDCAEQLRKNHSVTLQIVSQGIHEDIVTVHARATMGHGEGVRTDEDFGAVSVIGLKGEDRANAIMKAITKAKRRVTLSICGLGFLDETELPSEGGPPVDVRLTSNQQEARPALLAPTRSEPTAAPSAQPKAADAQIAELSHLKAQLQIDMGTWRSNILAKRNVTTARDLSPDQAAELIAKLRQKVAEAVATNSLPSAQLARPPEGAAPAAEDFRAPITSADTAF